MSQLIRSFIHRKLQTRVDIYVTSCIVSHKLGKGKSCALINPGNNEMCGTELPYFPVGGPVPPKLPMELKMSNSWGGMDIGNDQLYSTQVVDGHVSGLGGHSLKKQLDALPVVEIDTGFKCLVGCAVITEATEGLSHNFSHIIHTVPPFSSDKDMFQKLKKCYFSALEIATKNGFKMLNCPLLGSGARDIPNLEAIKAAEEALRIFPHLKQPFRFKFGLIDDTLVPLMEKQFNEQDVWMSIG